VVYVCCVLPVSYVLFVWRPIVAHALQHFTVHLPSAYIIIVAPVSASSLIYMCSKSSCILNFNGVVVVVQLSVKMRWLDKSTRLHRTLHQNVTGATCGHAHPQSAVLSVALPAFSFVAAQILLLSY